MIALALACLTCWVMVLAARPRRPLPGHEVQELVYSRLLGRQQTLVLVATVVSGIALVGFVVTASQRATADLRAARQVPALCASERDSTATCATAGPGEQWSGPIPAGR
jgi:hypothetical protein